jgi:3-oxoacyl-[acyl-carrier protein] reductase
VYALQWEQIGCKRKIVDMKLFFSGCRSLILGGSSELGIALAGMMIREGLFPFPTYRSSKGLERIENGLEKSKGNYSAVYFDLGIPDSAVSLFKALNQDLDYMVDLAHGDFEALVGSAESVEVERYFSENISARAGVMKMACRAMLRKRKGRFVFISSLAAGSPNSGQGFYAASKLAAEALYRNLALEMEGRGITGVSLRPGYIDSGRGRRYLQRQKGRLSKTKAESRVLNVEEAAETVLFFLSDSAEAFNAIEIPMNENLKEILPD